MTHIPKDSEGPSENKLNGPIHMSEKTSEFYGKTSDINGRIKIFVPQIVHSGSLHKSFQEKSVEMEKLLVASFSKAWDINNHLILDSPNTLF